MSNQSYGRRRQYVREDIVIMVLPSPTNVWREHGFNVDHS